MKVSEHMATETATVAGQNSGDAIANGNDNGQQLIRSG